jgi:NADPH:quinone reductase-like Zn-dependent oxidoreductase
MKAIVHNRYGSPEVLRYEEIEKSAPKDDEVLIRVRAASVNPADRAFMRGEPYVVRFVVGLSKSKVKRAGIDVSGLVEATGRNVTRFRPGDEVFGSCRGSFAEYVCAPESSLVTKPGNMTFEQAASVPVAGYTALQALRNKGHVRPGQKVLINGASGGVGTFAVQIAKSFGADVTGVCSTRNVEMVRSIGADHVIDYTQEDFTRGARRYEVIVDTAGNHSLAACRRVLSPTGIYVGVGGPWRGYIALLAQLITASVWSRFSNRKLRTLLARGSTEDLTILRDLMEAGKVTPVVDRRYDLREVPQAIHYLEQGHARGKIVITVQQDENAELP